MKRKRVVSAAGVAIFLLLIMAFVLPPVVSAADLEIECHVSPRSGYYNENFTYSVTIINNDIWRWDITSTLLRIYPSENAIVYYPRGNSTTIEIPSGKSKTVSFEVRLSDSNVYNDLRRDPEYQEWLRKDSSSEWTQLWYNFTVEAERGGSKKKLNRRGEGPILWKCLKVPDCKVTPISGYVTDNFSYSVLVEKDENVNATLPGVRVTLYTYSNESDDDTFCSYTKRFDMKDNEMLITFDNISLDRSCFMKLKGEYHDWLENSSDISLWTKSKYKLKVEWRGEGGEVHKCEGVDQILRKTMFHCYNPGAEYNKTKCNILSEKGLMPFDFTAKVKIAEPDNNVTLLVRNYTSPNDWDVKSFANYTSDLQENQTRVWHANLSKHNLKTEIDSGNVSSTINYKFYSPKVGRDCDYPGEKYFNPSERLKGTVESSVSPGEGTYNNTYTYNLIVNWSICDIFELQVRNYTKSDYWNTMEELNYTTPNIDQPLPTSPINLTSDHFSKERDGQYRFVSKVLNENFKFPGPIWTINLTQENITFSPKNGLYNSIFDFSLDVKANKNLTVKLFTICPNGEKKESEDYYTNAPEWQPLNWSVIPCENEATGTVEYWFEFWYWSLDLDTWIPVKRIPVDVTKTLPGPSVGYAVFKNEMVDPIIGNQNTRFDYSVNVTATIPGEVCLGIQKPDGGWKKNVECKPYNNSGSWQPISFNRIHVWFLVDEELGLPHYQFKFYEGDVCRGESEIFPGPELIEEQFTTDLFVGPDKGTNTTWFNFSTDVSSTKKGNIPVTLQVSLDEVADEEDWINVTNKSYENVKPGESILINFNVSIHSNLSSPQKQNLTSEWERKGVIYWQVKGLVCNSSIIPTNWDINLNWSNRNFSLEKGWWNDTFNFNVSLKADVKKGKVELLLKTNKSNLLGDEKNYTNGGSLQPFNWSVNLSEFIEKYEGETEYEFKFCWGNATNESGWLKGPYLYKQLRINFSNPHVLPKGGCIYSDSDALKYFKIDKIFNYSVNVSANKNTTVKLVVIDPYRSNLGFERKKYVTPEYEQPFSWNISSEELKIQSFGTWNYTFNYTYYDPHEDKKINKTWEWENETDGKGPEIYAVLSNLSIDPEYIVSNGEIQYGDTFNVSCDVNGTRDLNITLLLFCNNVPEPYKVNTTAYTGEEIKRIVKWKNINILNYNKHCNKFLLGLKVEEVKHK